MKRGILFVVLISFLSMVTYAQKKPVVKKKTTAPPAKTSAKGRSTSKAKVKPDSSKNSTNYPSVTGLQLADTSKKGGANFESPIDGYYVKNAISTAKPTKYAALREADIVFSKRIWREIDLRERMNQYMVSPKGRLIDVLMAAVTAGELTAYDASPNPAKGDPNGDEFKTPLTAEQAKGKMTDSTVVHKFDAKTGEDVGSKRVAGEFNPDSILRFRIKEDWLFDKQRSVLEPRIIGIAPLVRPKAAGVLLDYQPAFWIYFPEARKVLATKEIVMRHNDAASISYDQAFLKRIFSSYIVKVSNERDERIKDYMQGIDQLRESERVKKTIMDWELNLWQY
ncbi:gliding motility protein GldN [Mucilaginibacter sp. AW1-3]